MARSVCTERVTGGQRRGVGGEVTRRMGDDGVVGIVGPAVEGSAGFLWRSVGQAADPGH